MTLVARANATCILGALLISVLTPEATAQGTAGSVVGVVRDATDAVLPGVSVTIRHVDTATTYETVTNVQRLEGVAIDWIHIRDGSAQAGSTIGASRLRTRTGSSVVAVIRGSDTIAAPGPEVTLEPEDLVVAVGTSDGLRQLRELLEA